MGVARRQSAEIGTLGNPVERRPLALPDGAHMSLITAPRSLDSLEAGWRHLEECHAARHGVFQTFDWCRNWSRVYAAPGSGSALAVVAGRRNGALAFVWPLMAAAAGPASVLRWLSEPHAQYGDVLLAPSEDAAIWMEAALAFLQQSGGYDALWLRHVRDDATATEFLRARFNNAHLAERAPWMDLRQFTDEAAYDARYSSSQRKRRKKIRKALEDEFGQVEFKVLEPGNAVNAAIAEAVHEKSQWIDERGRHNQILGCPRLPRFLERMSVAAGSTRMIVTCMTAGGRPLSWEVGLRYRKTHFGFITSHVNALTDYSPARLHMDYSQRLALKDGMEVFDLMVPHDAHKESWCSAMMATNDYHLPLTSRGWVFGKLYLEALRPMLRAAYYRLPEGALKALKPILGH